MPDAYGNLLGQDEFANGVRVRFHSYLDSENLVLGVNLNGTYIHHLSAGPDPVATIFACYQLGGGFLLCQSIDTSETPMIWWSSQVEGPPMNLCPVDAAIGIEPEWRIFTVDFVHDCWFALNNVDHSYVVDIKRSDTTEGNTVQPYKWNGGANQIWRAQIVS